MALSDGGGGPAWSIVELLRQETPPHTHTQYSGIAVSLDAVSCDLFVSRQGCSCGVRVGDRLCL